MAKPPDPPKPPPGDVFIQEFMTAYLYGVYAMKGGRFAPSEAVVKMLHFASMAEKANALSLQVMGLLKPNKS